MTLYSPPPPAPTKRQWFKNKAIIIPIAAGLLGIGMGASTQPEPETVTVEKVVDRPVEKIVEKTVEVKVPTTPASCLTYIDLSEQAFSFSGESMGYMNEALQAAGKFNVAALNEASEKLKALNPKLTALTPQVNASKADCRASK